MSKVVRQIRQNIKKTKSASTVSPDLNALRALRTQGVNNAQALYQRGVGDTNYIASDVGNYLGAMNQKIGAGYDQAGQQMGAARASLQNQLAQGTQQNSFDANAELSRLGMSGVGLGHFNDDAAFMKNLASQQGTDEQNTNSLAKANAGSAGELLQGMNQAGRQSTLGELLNARNDDITQTRESFRQSRMDLINQARANAAAAKLARINARSSGGGSGYYHRSFTPYHRYSSGGSSGGSNPYDHTAGYQALIDAINGGGGQPNQPKPKTSKPKKTNWVNDTMGFLFGG